MELVQDTHLLGPKNELPCALWSVDKGTEGFLGLRGLLAGGGGRRINHGLLSINQSTAVFGRSVSGT